MKPICCGDRRDAELLLAAGSDGLTIDEINPVWLKTPAAPSWALDGKSGHRCRSYPRCLSCSSEQGSNTSSLKGAGGWMVPIRRYLFCQRPCRGDEVAGPAGCIQSARLPESCGADCGEYCRDTDCNALGLSLNDRSRTRGYRRSDQCDILSENSGFRSCRTRRKLTEFPADWRPYTDWTIV